MGQTLPRSAIQASILLCAMTPLLGCSSSPEDDIANAVLAVGGSVEREDGGRHGRVMSVSLSRTSVTDDFLLQLSRCTQIKRIDLSQTRISDCGIRNVCSLPNLEELDLSFTNMTDDGLTLLRTSTVTRLNLRGTKITDIGAEILKTHTRIVDLNVAETTISNRGFRSISEMKQLQRLHIYGTALSDDGVDKINQLINLSDLDLSRTSISDKGFRYLCELPQLEHLNVASTSIRKPDFACLATCRLRDLNLFGTNLADESLTSLKAMKSLETLSLSSCKNITDASTRALVACASLKQLYLSDTSLSDKATALIKVSMPQCNVHIDGQ